MFKSTIAFIILMAATTSCDQPSAGNVGLSDKECWTDLKPGSKVSGRFLVYYFPKESTFLSKPRCHPAAIPLVLNDKHSHILVELANQHNTGDMMGLSAYYNISGHIFKNKNNPDLLLKAGSMQIDQKSNVQVLR